MARTQLNPLTGKLRKIIKMKVKASRIILACMVIKTNRALLIIIWEDMHRRNQVINRRCRLPQERSPKCLHNSLSMVTSLPRPLGTNLVDMSRRNLKLVKNR